jgi:hypothetical protein
MQLLSLTVELIWSLPLIVLSVLVSQTLFKITQTARPTLGVMSGTGLGILYAVAISLFAGPMVTAVAIPLLPFMATVGALAGLLSNTENLRQAIKPPRVYVFLGGALFLWIGFFALRDSITSSNSYRVVVVKRNTLSESLQWDTSGGSINLSEVERKRVQEAIGSIDGGLLTPVLSLNSDEHPHRTVIIVMISDVSKPIHFTMPDSGVVIFIQDQDGTWREDRCGAQPGRNDLTLVPVSGSNVTRIQVAGPFGTQSSEVSISHK